MEHSCRPPFNKFFAVSVLVLFLSVPGSLLAKKKIKEKDFKTKVVPVAKTEIVDYDKTIQRTDSDKKYDALINQKLGENFRRASVYDFYPLEVDQKLSHEDQVAMLDYYNYARRDLEKISSSKLLKVLTYDFDSNGIKDHAVIVHDKLNNKNFIAVLGSGKQPLHLEVFNYDFIEIVNNGICPTTLIIADKKRTIMTPGIRLVKFNTETKILYYDKAKKNWSMI